MKKVRLIVACLLLVISNPCSVGAASGSASGTSGGHYYHTSGQNDTDIWVHYYSTNVMHTKGTETKINITSALQHSHSSSQSITAGGTFFITLAGTIGFSQTQSYSTSVGHTFTIKPSEATSWWRVVHVFPTTRAVQTRLDSEGQLVFRQTVTYAPDTNQAYHRLYRYQ